MKYEYSPKAGYYGTGGWVCYTLDCFGYKNTKRVFATEEEAAEFCGVSK